MALNLDPDVRNVLTALNSGDVQLQMPGDAATSAADLNSAAEDEFTKTLYIYLVDSAGNILELLDGFDVDVSISGSFSDGEISAPSLDDATPTVKKGVVTVTLTYDTDGGTYKDYQDGDSVTVTASGKSGTVLDDAYGVSDDTWSDNITS